MLAINDSGFVFVSIFNVTYQVSSSPSNVAVSLYFFGFIIELLRITVLLCLTAFTGESEAFPVYSTGVAGMSAFTGAKRVVSLRASPFISSQVA